MSEFFSDVVDFIKIFVWVMAAILLVSFFGSYGQHVENKCLFQYPEAKYNSKYGCYITIDGRNIDVDNFKYVESNGKIVLKLKE